MPLRKVEHLAESACSELPEIAEPQNGLIPPIHWLARHWDVSTATANRVLRKLLRDGFLEKNQRRNRYFIAGTPQESEPDQTLPRHADRVGYLAQRIRSDMINEAELRKALPSIRQMMTKYQCSYYTCRRAIARLRDQGWINPDGHLRPSSESDRSAANTALYLVCHRRAINTPSGRRFLGEMERMTAATPNGTCRYLFIDQIRKNGLPKSYTVAGYICYEPRKYRLPKHVHAEVPVVYVSNRPEKDTDCTYVGKDEQSAGREAAEHLNVLGHRHIGVISHLPESTTPWVRDRISGISRIYPRQGSLRSMTVFHSSSKLGKTNPKMPRQVWENRFLSSGLLKDIEKKLPPKIVRNLGVDQVYQIRQLADLSEFLQPVFHSALKKKQITAWICINDESALGAHHFLRRNGIAVPQEISLMGFDNTTGGRLIELSTYDFRPESAARAAILTLNRSTKRVASNRDYTVQGCIIARSTTGKPPIQTRSADSLS